MTFTQAFRPALNKDGYARLQFIGYEVKKGISQQTNKETGEVVDKPYELFSIIFDVKGVVRGTNQKVSITTGLTYSDDNLLGKTLEALGFKNEIATELDDEGFEVVAVSQDEDGFEEIENNELEIESFLDSIKDKIFVAKLNKATEGKRKGFWEVDVSSLKPFIKV